MEYLNLLSLAIAILVGVGIARIIANRREARLYPIQLYSHTMQAILSSNGDANISQTRVLIARSKGIVRWQEHGLGGGDSPSEVDFSCSNRMLQVEKLPFGGHALSFDRPLDPGVPYEIRQLVSIHNAFPSPLEYIHVAFLAPTRDFQVSVVFPPDRLPRWVAASQRRDGATEDLSEELRASSKLQGKTNYTLRLRYLAPATTLQIRWEW